MTSNTRTPKKFIFFIGGVLGVIRWPELAWKDSPLCRLIFDANHIVSAIQTYRFTLRISDGKMDGRTDGRKDGRTDPSISLVATRKQIRHSSDHKLSMHSTGCPYAIHIEHIHNTNWSSVVQIEDPWYTLSIRSISCSSVIQTFIIRSTN